MKSQLICNDYHITFTMVSTRCKCQACWYIDVPVQYINTLLFPSMLIVSSLVDLWFGQSVWSNVGLSQHGLCAKITSFGKLSWTMGPIFWKISNKFDKWPTCLHRRKLWAECTTHAAAVAARFWNLCKKRMQVPSLSPPRNSHSQLLIHFFHMLSAIQKRETCLPASLEHDAGLGLEVNHFFSNSWQPQATRAPTSLAYSWVFFEYAH